MVGIQKLVIKHNKYFFIILILIIEITIEENKKFNKPCLLKKDNYYHKLKTFRFLQSETQVPQLGSIQTQASQSDSIETQNSQSDSTETQASQSGSTQTQISQSGSTETQANLSDSTDDSIGNFTLDIGITPEKSSGGLSTGGIIGIAIPCILAVIGAAVVAAICSGKSKPPINPVINNTAAIPTIIESSMEQLEIGPTQPPVEVVTQPQIQTKLPTIQEIIHPANIVFKESPSIPQVNRVFEPMYPVKKIVPVTKVVEIKQPSPQITKVSHVMTSPQISQIGTSQKVSQVITSQKIPQVVTSPQVSQVVKTQQISQVIQPQHVSQINLPDPKPDHYISESKIISESQVLPEIKTTQITASKVLPLKIIPQINRKEEVLPVKVLPTIIIDQGTIDTTNIVDIPQITQINNNIITNQIEKPVHSSQISENIAMNNSINNLDSKNYE